MAVLTTCEHHEMPWYGAGGAAFFHGHLYNWRGSGVNRASAEVINRDGSRIVDGHGKVRRHPLVGQI
jgi:hypothetical protein